MSAIKIAASLLPLLIGSSAGSSDGSVAIERVSEILSDIPFGPISADRIATLRVEGDKPCTHWSDCSYFSDGPVAHSIYDGRVVVKWLDVPANGHISAFSIGLARDRAHVMPAIEAHLPGVHLDCFAPSPATGTQCSAEIGEGSIMVEFDVTQKLKSIRLDDWNGG